MLYPEKVAEGMIDPNSQVQTEPNQLKSGSESEKEIKNALKPNSSKALRNPKTSLPPESQTKGSEDNIPEFIKVKENLRHVDIEKRSEQAAEVAAGLRDVLKGSQIVNGTISNLPARRGSGSDKHQGRG